MCEASSNKNKRVIVATSDRSVEDSCKPYLQNLADKKEITISGDELSVGRSLDANLKILDETISRKHCLLKKELNTWFLHHLGSSFSWINGKLLKSGEKVKLQNGDLVDFNAQRKYSFRFHVPSVEPEPKRARQAFGEINENSVSLSSVKLVKKELEDERRMREAAEFELKKVQERLEMLEAQHQKDKKELEHKIQLEKLEAQKQRKEKVLLEKKLTYEKWKVKQKLTDNQYKCTDYMKNQQFINSDMRAILINWMVEVQGGFDLDPESLYLAVKIIDLYMCQVSVRTTRLQLVGITALFIASRYNAQQNIPSIEDFNDICDGAYKVTDILEMEMHIIRTLNFDLGAPLSYRILRLLAKRASVPMPVLTLARYILELSLVQYASIFHSESKLAAAALFLALKMKKMTDLTPTLVQFSGFDVKDLSPTVLLLNHALRENPKSNISAIKEKYSDKLFFEVAKTELLSNEDLRL